MATATYDVIIAGARCAGAATAMLLARRGFRVLLVDRSRLPSDIPHGHMIHKDAPRRLREWGLLDRIVDAGTPPVRTVTTYFGDFPLVARELDVDGLAWGYGPRRKVVDAILLEAAIAAGAEFRDGVAVEDLTFDGGRVTGIRGRTGGATFTERADITVGADGRNSRVAERAGAVRYEEVPTLLCYYFSYWSGVPSDGQEIYCADARLAFAFPTNDGLFAVFAAWPIERFHEVRSDIERHFVELTDSFPGLGERLRQGVREERFSGTADLPNFFRKPYGDGWALVGDASYHKDPFMALGMADAFRGAELLATAIDDGLSGRVPAMDAMANYESKRNEASMRDYQENLAMARLQPPPPNVLALRTALRHQPEEATRFWLARSGMIPPEQFFNPQHLARVMAGGASPV